MDLRYWVFAIGTTVVLLFIFVFARSASFHRPSGRAVSAPATTVLNSPVSLIVEPDQGVAPVLEMIEGASSSVDLVIYELNDPQIENALVADERRGISVRVLLGGGYKGASSTFNLDAYDIFSSNGVPVRWTPAYFSLTHQKTFIFDRNRALIMSFNLVPKYYPTGRDFGIVDSDRKDVSAIENTFDADWDGNNSKANGGDDLVWSPGSEAAMISFINGARQSLEIYNEEISDMPVVFALIRAAQRSVDVLVDMTYSSQWQNAFEELDTAGAHIRTYDESAPLYIHAKMIVADGARAFVGSENFSPTSLDENRELGIMITDKEIIASLMKTFGADWSGATPFQ
jgi:cardiolipin synthase